MSNFLRGETWKQRQELVYPCTKLERLKWNTNALLALLLSPVKATSGSVCLNAQLWLWQPQRCSWGTAGIRVLRNATTELSSPAPEEVGEGADKGNCYPQCVAGETERGTGSNLRSEPRHLPLAEGTHWAGNTPAHTCAQPWQRPCPSAGCATETGLQNYPGELLIPISQFLFSKSHAF